VYQPKLNLLQRPLESAKRQRVEFNGDANEYRTAIFNALCRTWADRAGLAYLRLLLPARKWRYFGLFIRSTAFHADVRFVLASIFSAGCVMKMVVGKGWWPFWKATFSHLHPEMQIHYIEEYSGPFGDFIGWLVGLLALILAFTILCPFGLIGALWEMVRYAHKRYIIYVVKGVQ
jgi:hypothetical protein